jgi:lipopolysaccharide transport protein LptA/LPS export ABC transporter protein LptC
MATAYAPELPPLQPRQTGSGLVMSRDRSTEFSRARRRTIVVRLLRITFPITALVVLLGYGLTILQTAGWGTGLPEIAIKNILPQDLAMHNPHYQGFGDDGSSYNFTAKTAQQELANPNQIKLNEITGAVLQPDKTKTDISAARGLFDHSASVLELYERINVVSESGLKADLTRATILTKENLITSNEPVLIEFPSGNLRAKNMRLRQKAREATFVDAVVVSLTPPPPDPQAAVSKPDEKESSLFTPSNGPVNINAERLDVNDTSQVAVFTGNVRVNQAGAELTTPELEVTYEGGGMMSMGSGKSKQAAQTPNQTAANPTSKVQRIVAKEPVVMTRSTGEIVTSDNADFDAPHETAILTGNVVMTSGDDRRAVSDRVDLDQRADTALLTGNVVVTQGQNELSGGRLLIERKSGRAELTTPPALGNGPGRITARLVRGEAKPGASNKAKAIAAATQAASQGEGMAAFKTDPNAPVNIEADELEINDTAKVAIFRGNVRADQGGFIINSAELHAFYKGEAGLADVTRTASEDASQGKKPQTELTRIEAKKNVFITSSEGRTASGDTAEFNAKTNMITMGGDVVLTQGDNMVRGARLLIDMNTGETKIDTAPGKVDTGPDKTAAQPAGGGWVTEAPSGAAPTESNGRASAVFFPQQLKAGKSKDASKQPPASTNGAATIDGWSAKAP